MMRSLTALLVCFVAVACGGAEPDGLWPAGSGGKADDATSEGRGFLPKIVPVVVGPELDAWAQAQGIDLQAPGKPFRTVFARLQRKLVEAGVASTALAYMFGPADDPGTQDLRAALDATPSPVTLIEHPETGDPGIYNGSNRLIGHATLTGELLATSSNGGVKVAAGRKAVPILQGETLPLPAVTYMAYLTTRDMDLDTARSIATAAMECMAETVTSGYVIENGQAVPTRQVEAFFIQEERVEPALSALSVLEPTPAGNMMQASRESSVAKSLRGAVAIVADPMEVDLLLRDDGSHTYDKRGVVYAHAWALASIARMAISDDCPAARDLLLGPTVGRGEPTREGTR